jgi:hypothetical protein
VFFLVSKEFRRLVSNVHLCSGQYLFNVILGEIRASCLFSIYNLADVQNRSLFSHKTSGKIGIYCRFKWNYETRVPSYKKVLGNSSEHS